MTNQKTENRTPQFSQTSELKLNGTTYIVNTYCNPDGRETAEDKLFKFVSERISAELKPESQAAAAPT